MGTHNIIICTKYIPFDSLFCYVLTNRLNLFQRPHLFTKRILLFGTSGTVVLDLDWSAEAETPDFSSTRGTLDLCHKLCPHPLPSITKLPAIFSISLKVSWSTVLRCTDYIYMSWLF